MEFVIGGLAGAGATMITNPIDVVKTRLQLQGELRARTEHTPHFRSMPHAMYTIGRTEGLRALQKGLSPALLFGFTMSSVRLGLFQTADYKGWTKNKGGDVSVHKSMAWSCVSGALGGAAANPATVVKTRMQAASHPSIAVGRQYYYTGTLDAFITIFKTEGLRGYFAGVHATMLRVAIGSMTQLTTFSTTKEALYNHGVCRESNVGLAFCASALSGPAVALVMCPFDVVTIRLYNQGSAVKGKQLYTGFLDCITKVYRIEGLHGLYKGLGPLYFRIAPQTTLSLVIWDMLNNIYIKNKININSYLLFYFILFVLLLIFL